MKLIEYIFMITITLEIQNLIVTVTSKENDMTKLKQDLKVYIEEANYPLDEDLNIISNDLKVTLELDTCFIQRKNRL